MMTKFFRFFMLTPVVMIVLLSQSFAGMSGNDFSITLSVMDSAGESKSSTGFALLDSVGQSTPIGVSTGNNFELEAGFIFGTQFSAPLGDTASDVIDGLNDILNDPAITLTKQEKKSLNQAIKFLEDTMDAFALYEAGDDAALTNALNKTMSAINKMLAVDGVDTTAYQLMLAQAAQLAVGSEIDRIAAATPLGEGEPAIIQARIFFSDGSAKLLAGIHDTAVQSFKKAYNEALLSP